MLQLHSFHSFLPILLILKGNLNRLLSAMFKNPTHLIAAGHYESHVIFRADQEIITLQLYHPMKRMMEV